MKREIFMLAILLIFTVFQAWGFEPPSCDKDCSIMFFDVQKCMDLVNNNKCNCTNDLMIKNIAKCQKALTSTSKSMTRIVLSTTDIINNDENEEALKLQLIIIDGFGIVFIIFGLVVSILPVLPPRFQFKCFKKLNENRFRKSFGPAILINSIWIVITASSMFRNINVHPHMIVLYIGLVVNVILAVCLLSSCKFCKSADTNNTETDGIPNISPIDEERLMGRNTPVSCINKDNDDTLV